MSRSDSAPASSTPPGKRRLWRFADCAVDEANRVLTVGGAVVELEAKPFDLLLELMRHAGEVVTKDELLDAVWPGVTVVEGSLTTALSKLRKAIGDNAGAVIVTVPRVGYRLAATVTAQSITARAPQLSIEPGAPAPSGAQWRYVERIGHSPHADVWRIAHDKTRATRVLKLAADAERLRALRREVAVARLLRESLGERPDFVPVIDWNFAEQPYFVESEDGGPSLPQWAEQQGGLAATPLALRIELAIGVALAVAAAHGVGVLHKDLKPDNILVTVDRNGHWQPKVVDFGSAALLEPERLDRLGISHTGMADLIDGEAGGTAVWLAPELFAGEAPSTASDVYALGVLLYQLVVGDLRRPLASGWEADIDDPLLRDDIAAAAAGDRARRLAGAEDLARRLRELAPRRREAAEASHLADRARDAEARLARIGARRPWMVAAGAALLIGAAFSTAMSLRADRARAAAERQTRLAGAINGFLANDLLARTNPFRSTTATESFIDAVRQTTPLIDQRFAGEPAVAARLHETVANAFDKRSNWSEARAEYARAQALWEKAGPSHIEDAAINRLERSMMEARSYQDGSTALARAELDKASATLTSVRDPRPETAVWLASARGMLALVENDAKTANQQFSAAVAASARTPDLDPTLRLNLRQRLAFSKIRLGDGAGAEADFRALARDFAALEGAQGPNTLMMQMNIIQALMIGGRHDAVVKEATRLHPILAARLGEDHEMSLQLLTTQAQSEGVLERWADATRDDLKVHALALKTLGPRSFFAVASLVDASTAQCRGGHGEAGLAHAEQAYRDALAGFGKVALTDAAAYTVAECEIGLGRYDAAARHLSGIDAAAVAQLAGDPNWGANVTLAQARIDLALGRQAEARRALDAAKPVFGRAGAEPYQARLWRSLDQRAGAT